ncbi:hypothetical protein [Pseudomonas sp. NFX15]|uniref:hypothetical protein n=1 Tax=Pseudomonas sp. NFX15 TaxID=2816958 RepID=UPI003B8C1293
MYDIQGRFQWPPKVDTSSASLLCVPHLPWWKQVVIYQGYPRSFADANDDGIGDLPGK